MAFLRAGLQQDPHFFIRGDRVFLRPLSLADYSSWAELRALSREHLVPWEPAWSRDELSRSAFRRRLRHYQKESREDQGYAFAIFSEHGSNLLGGISLSNVRRGVTQAASLGYWVGRTHVGKGVMTRGLQALIPFAFRELRLHRIEAACMPSNASSIAVLLKCGFVREGLARSYLKINGKWQDHILFARVNEDDDSTDIAGGPSSDAD